MELIVGKALCRLCLESSVDCQPLEGFTSYKLKFIVPIIDLDLTCDPKICKTCFTGLVGHDLFKSMCLDNNEPMHNFAELEFLTTRNCSMSMYMRNEEKRKTCGLCHGKENILGQLKENLDKVLRIMLARCLPDLDDMVSTVCKNCLDSLKKLFTFVNGCMDTEAKIRHYCCLKGLNGRSKVNLNDVLRFTHNAVPEDGVCIISDPEEQSCDVSVKSEAVSDEVEVIEDSWDFEVDIKHEPEIVIEEGPHRGLIENYAEGLLMQDDHQPGHSVERSMHTSPNSSPVKNCKTATSTTRYKCASCNYATRRKTRLRLHGERYHVRPSRKVYKCVFCAHRTSSKYASRGHERLHLDGEVAIGSMRGSRDHRLPHSSVKGKYKRRSKASRKKIICLKGRSVGKELTQEISTGGNSDQDKDVVKQNPNEPTIEKKSVQNYLKNKQKTWRGTKVNQKTEKILKSHIKKEEKPSRKSYRKVKNGQK